mgnify:CR=1 FL=1
MEENFDPVARTRANYYTPGSPVQFVCVELLKGESSGEHAVCLTFKNISKVTLTALEIHFKCKGVDGIILCEDEFEYRDIAVKPGESFGMDDAVFVTQKAITSVDVSLKNVYNGKRVVHLDAIKRVRLPAPRRLSPELQKALEARMNRQGLKYMPQVFENGWYCACGAFHPKEEDTVYCTECGCDRILLQNALNTLLQPEQPDPVPAAQPEAPVRPAQPAAQEEPTRIMSSAAQEEATRVMPARPHVEQAASFAPRVVVNHAGTILTAKPLKLPESGRLALTDEEGLNFTGGEITAYQFREEQKKDRHTEEVEAESISYTVCQYYGIETADNSFGYIAGWSQGKDLQELRASLETINHTASELITDIDRNFAEICKERGITLAAAEQPKEAMYQLDDSMLLHLQPTDSGYDYTIYDSADKHILDGGRLSDAALDIAAAQREVFALHELEPDVIEELSQTEMQRVLENTY